MPEPWYSKKLFYQQQQQHIRLQVQGESKKQTDISHSTCNEGSTILNT
jgi:hypothetical protein